MTTNTIRATATEGTSVAGTGERPHGTGERPHGTGRRPPSAEERPLDAGERPHGAGERPLDAGGPAVTTDMARVLALDIGGTKFAAAVVDGSGGLQQRVEVPIGPDPTATLSALVTSLASVPGLAGVGIGTAGPLDRRRVSPVNIPAWRDFPLADTVSELAGGLPVAIAGDAQCMALGEWWRGGHAAPGRTMLGVVVSTGVGGGLVIDGTPLLGPTGNAGHIGHITVDPHGEPCPCGAVGCVEVIASGPAMTRWALAHGWHPSADAQQTAQHSAARDVAAQGFAAQDVPAQDDAARDVAARGSAAQDVAAQDDGAQTSAARDVAAQSVGTPDLAAPGAAVQSIGAPDSAARGVPTRAAQGFAAQASLVPGTGAQGIAVPDARMLAADARMGVPVALAAFERAADALAIAFLTAAALCDIDRIVVGGGVAAAGDTLLYPLHQAVKRRGGMHFLRRLHIEATTLGRDAGLYGAAALALAPTHVMRADPGSV